MPSDMSLEGWLYRRDRIRTVVRVWAIVSAIPPRTWRVKKPISRWPATNSSKLTKGGCLRQRGDIQQL